jgi:uracil-DNA glycosylase
MLSTKHIHPSWQMIVDNALSHMDADYLKHLGAQDFLPKRVDLFNAFSLPLDQVQFVLFGESPYPRADSANGYAFWDAAVSSLWSDTGLSKPVNRATSLRNILKMLLVTAGLLSPDHTTQEAIALIDKSHLVQTLSALFENLQKQGVLLLNASLVLSDLGKQVDAKQWQPFVNHILKALHPEKPNAKLILFGKIAERILSLDATIAFETHIAEHPYNISFIQNSTVQALFKPFDLLSRHKAFS